MKQADIFILCHLNYTTNGSTALVNFPVDTGRKLNVHKMFRRRPGRLLNVSYTFNLRSASTRLIEANAIPVYIIVPIREYVAKEL